MSRRAWAAYRARELEATLFEANGGSDLGPLSARRPGPAGGGCADPSSGLTDGTASQRNIRRQLVRAYWSPGSRGSREEKVCLYQPLRTVRLVVRGIV